MRVARKVCVLPCRVSSSAHVCARSVKCAFCYAGFRVYVCVHGILYVCVHRLVSQACDVFMRAPSLPARASGGVSKGVAGSPPPSGALVPLRGICQFAGTILCVSVCLYASGVWRLQRSQSLLFLLAWRGDWCAALRSLAPRRWPLWSASLAELVLLASDRTSTVGALCFVRCVYMWLVAIVRETLPSGEDGRPPRHHPGGLGAAAWEGGA